MHLTTRLVRHRLAPDATVFVNTLSGAVDVLSDEQVLLVDRLVTGDDAVHARAPRLFERLLARGHVYPSAHDEALAFTRLRERSRRIEQAESVLFAVCPTYACFFRCGYCYEGALTAQPHASDVGADHVVAGMAALRAWLEREMKVEGTPRVTFLGGEPLQESLRDLVIGCVREVAARGWRFRIITNGYLLSAFVDDLLGCADALDAIQVTLDGPPPVHDRRRQLVGGAGTFERIADNVGLALDAGLPVSLRTNVDADNVDRLPDLGRAIRARGWLEHRRFHAHLAPTEDSTCRGLRDVLREDRLLARWLPLRESKEHGPDVSMFDDAALFQVTAALEATLRRSRRAVLPRFSYCAATKARSFVFGPDGRIYQCLRGVGDERTAVGTYFPDLAMDRARVDRWLSRDVAAIQCPRCASVATLAGGGCALESIHREGDLGRCSCGEAEDVLRGYLDLRRDVILDRLAPRSPIDSTEEPRPRVINQ